MNFMKLVEFENGKFGVRTGWLGSFVDNSCNGRVWGSTDHVIRYCQTTREDAELIIAFFEERKIKKNIRYKVIPRTVEIFSEGEV